MPQEFKDAMLFISPSRRIKKAKVIPRIISVLHVQYVYGKIRMFLLHWIVSVTVTKFTVALDCNSCW